MGKGSSEQWGFMSASHYVLCSLRACRTQMDIVSMLFMSYQFIFSGIFQPLSESAVPQLAYTHPLYYAECLLARVVFQQVFALDEKLYSNCTRPAILLSLNRPWEGSAVTILGRCDHIREGIPLIGRGKGQL